MIDSRSSVLAAFVIIGWFAASAAAADAYPTKPVRFIVPSAAGSGTDIIARILGQRMAERWGQPVIIDDREGAGGVIGTELAARAPADGSASLLVAFLVLSGLRRRTWV